MKDHVASCVRMIRYDLVQLWEDVASCVRMIRCDLVQLWEDVVEVLFKEILQNFLPTFRDQVFSLNVSKNLPLLVA